MSKTPRGPITQNSPAAMRYAAAANARKRAGSDFITAHNKAALMIEMFDQLIAGLDDPALNRAFMVDEDGEENTPALKADVTNIAQKETMKVRKLIGTDDVEKIDVTVSQNLLKAWDDLGDVLADKIGGTVLPASYEWATPSKAGDMNVNASAAHMTFMFGFPNFDGHDDLITALQNPLTQQQIRDTIHHYSDHRSQSASRH